MKDTYQSHRGLPAWSGTGAKGGYRKCLALHVSAIPMLDGSYETQVTLTFDDEDSRVKTSS